jgi:outer membrane protein OmpA-like peptidoglycan-associated protein
MHNHQSMHYPNYARWTWIVALILALILLWMLFTGHGPNTSCCVAPVEPATSAVAPIAEPSAVMPAFGFTASANDFSSDGDSANVSWLNNTDALKTLLASGQDLQAQGDDKEVVLRGNVNSEEIKQKIGADAQAFFGSSITIDNQIVVASPEPVAVEPPPAAKLYFDTGKAVLQAESATTIAPIIAWLSAHPESKAVISGFHDARGNQKSNEDLAYRRAKTAQAALIEGGVDVMRIEFVKPEVVDGGSDMAEARRVEVSVK